MMSLATRRSPSRAGAIAALAALFALTACSSIDAQAPHDAPQEQTSLLPAAEGTTKYPLTLKNAYGETVLKERPDRIAVIGFNTNFDYLQALKVTPVYAITEDSEWEWRDQDWLSGIETIDTATRRDEITFEGIAEAEPDLILAFGAFPDEIQYEKLATIAPILAEEQIGDVVDESWRNQQLQVGKALDLVEAALSAVEEADSEIARIVADHPEFAGRTITYATEYSGGYGLSYQSVTGSMDEASFLELGFAPNPLAENFLGDATISDENLPKIDADILIVNYADEELRVARESQPLFQAIPAVAAGRYLSLTDNPASNYTTLLLPDGTEIDGADASWVLHRGPSSLSFPWALDIVANDWLSLLDLTPAH